jgi:acyl-coenzyme A thioesterase PaaI-like protein
MPIFRCTHRVDDLSRGRAVMSLPVAERHTLDGSTVQAGVTAMLADFAAVAAEASVLPDSWLAATTGFSVHHLTPAHHSGVRVAADCHRQCGEGGTEEPRCEFRCVHRDWFGETALSHRAVHGHRHLP